jgi:hypothetical protein
MHHACALLALLTQFDRPEGQCFVVSFPSHGSLVSASMVALPASMLAFGVPIDTLLDKEGYQAKCPPKSSKNQPRFSLSEQQVRYIGRAVSGDLLPDALCGPNFACRQIALWLAQVSGSLMPTPAHM